MRGGAKLTFARERGQTVLRTCCSQLPLQIFQPIPGPSGEAIVTVMCPTGDLLCGDEVRLQVTCGPGTDVILRQASGTRLHACDEGQIVFDGRFEVGPDARLRYLPWELIPFANTAYRQRLQVDLAEGGEATLREVVGPGRVWEVDAPRRLSLAVESRVDGDLAFADVLRLTGQNPIATARRTHTGSLLLLGPHYIQDDADRIDAALRGAGLLASASLLPRYGIGVRALGNSADALFRAFDGCSPLAR